MDKHGSSDPFSLEKMAAVDLFCGAGGLTRGLIDAGIPVVSGYDFDGDCGYAYERNNRPARFVKADISEVDSELIRRDFSGAKTKILVGCAPCQPFSTYTHSRRSQTDNRWPLLLEFGRIVKDVLPDIVSMENVPGLQNQDIYREFTDLLNDCGYFVSAQIVSCSKIGVPQNRKRLVLLASRLGKIELDTQRLDKAIRVSVKEAIGHLPKLAPGEQCSQDRFHRCAQLSHTNKERIRHSRPGGTWRDWPENLVSACHQSSTGQSYDAVYGRMIWDEPSPTITTQFYAFGSGRFGHPEQDRALSLREGALIQTFPEDYEFCDPQKPMSFQKVGKLIGNAVPVQLGKVIGHSIVSHLENLESTVAN